MSLMANNKEPRNPFLKGLRSLNNITRSTETSTYGVGRDVADVLTSEVNNFTDKLLIDSDKDRSLINSHMTKYRLYNASRERTSSANIYNIINDSNIMESVQTLMGGENVKFSQLLKDYEIIKRCIPQVHKVITSLKNNIISPDAMLDSAIGIELPASISSSDKDKINDIIEKYKLNEKLQDYVMEYLIASVKYVTVVPYNIIPKMLDGEYKNIDECIEELESEASNKPKTLLEWTGYVNSVPLTESVDLDYIDNDTRINHTFTVTPDELRVCINESLNNIEFIKGGADYFKNAVLNEAVSIKNNMNGDTSMKSILKRMKSRSKTISSDMVQVVDGLVDPDTLKDIKKNVDFKGCHIEELATSRVIPFKLRDTIVGYFYVEDNVMPGNTQRSNISTIMDKINASVYMKHDVSNQAARVELAVIKTIADKMIECIDSKFINDNYEDMDIIYEFIRVNEIHKKHKRVVFFHPDDVCEFKRKDGSIMKNCMFMAKLYILTTLANVLTNVTRGADRNIHYVKTGLTTDIEGHVNAAIRAIKQGQIRYSDIGTINEIFNIVGASTDVFMPVSVDGERPIETETISGQNVDMNTDFLNYMLKSIIQSFGVPSSVVDDFENIDFAKTISMSNIEMAKAVLDAQNEISEPLTKLIRSIITYELPEFTEVDEIKAKLNPPAIIVFEMNKDRIDSVNQISEVLANLLFSQNENETENEKLLRMFKLEYMRKNIPTLNWDVIDEIVAKIRIDSKGEILQDNLRLGNSNNGFQEQPQNMNNDYSQY